MPTVTVKRDLLFKKIGQHYTDDEFDKLCFDFGIELDEVVDTDVNNVEYKIDIPANRYDLLCVEGISTALAVFTNNYEIISSNSHQVFLLFVDNKHFVPIRISTPKYTKVLPKTPIITYVEASTKPIRPFVVTAALRNFKITPEVYDSLIDLQERLHFNVCRKRTLVAIGVHDLDSLTPPFRYSADSPKDIRFQPLNQTKEFRADELMEFYQKDTHLKPYLHIIKDEPAYPVIRDSKGVILSLPPIINGDHSKVSMATKNIFIECTATDLTKAEVVLDTLVTMLSEHCNHKYEIEATRVIYEEHTVEVYPTLEYKVECVNVDLANKTVGIELTADKMAQSLSRMGLKSTVGPTDGKITVEIPPTRHDIIHQCDIMEDVAISYGYSNIVPRLPPTPTVAAQYPLNKLTLQLRESMAQAGFTEALTFSLCSVEDECEKMLQPRETKEPTLARVANPKTQEFQAARNSLLPGLLKTIQANKNVPLPMKLFEISDVVVLDEKTDTGARNSRHLCVVNYDKTPGFATVHGILDRFMQLLEMKFQEDYVLKAADDPSYFPGRCAEVLYRGKVIGKLGVLHPKVVENFDCNMPCSALEIEIEDFL